MLTIQWLPIAVFIILYLMTNGVVVAQSVDSLCNKPIISSADRMMNGTIRLYRDKHYWVLKGVVDSNTGQLDGPFPLPYEKMNPVERNQAVVTILSGSEEGRTAKIENKVFWLWDEKGKLKTEEDGQIHNRFPDGGFEAAIHNGNPDDPQLIGFRGIKVYYFSTRYKLWTIDNRPSGWNGGKNGEEFPTDLTAAFSVKANDPKDGYIVYFFKKSKYCKRTKVPKTGANCQTEAEWLPNKDLFGCNAVIESAAFRSDNQTVAQTDSQTDSQTKPSVTNKPSLAQSVVINGAFTSLVVIYFMTKFLYYLL